MTRTYTLKKRAEQQAETRQRIVEAAVDLHRTIGPGQTTISMVSERAGVQRHTFYAHFSDERSLLLACSGLVAERDAPPDAEPWRAIGDRGERLRAGLAAIYMWYARNPDLLASVLRDAETHPLVREVIELRQGAQFEAYRNVLGAGLDGTQRALLRVALSFFTWRTLAQESSLDPEAAAAAMAGAITCAGR